MSNELLKQALDTCERAISYLPEVEIKDEANNAITLLRAAIDAEQAKGREAVVRLVVPESCTGLITGTTEAAHLLPPGEYFCYTTPPAQPAREWVDIPDEVLPSVIATSKHRGIVGAGRAVADWLREKNAGQPVVKEN